MSISHPTDVASPEQKPASAGTSAETSQLPATDPLQPNATMLFDFWYPAMRSKGIATGRVYKSTLLGVPLVLGRTDTGRLFAMRDNCPHRGIPLSCGQFDGTVLECCYHGWKFDALSGQCAEIPSLTDDSKLKIDRIFSGSFPCEERDAYAWVYITAPGSR